jgi:hypothetical protein
MFCKASFSGLGRNFSYPSLVLIERTGRDFNRYERDLRREVTNLCQRRNRQGPAIKVQLQIVDGKEGGDKAEKVSPADVVKFVQETLFPPKVARTIVLETDTTVIEPSMILPV